MYNDPLVKERVLNASGTVCVSGVVVEEMLVRGFLTEITKIRSGRSRAELGKTYSRFLFTVKQLGRYNLLPCTDEA